jgi:hypothetical protein
MQEINDEHKNTVIFIYLLGIILYICIIIALYNCSKYITKWSLLLILLTIIILILNMYFSYNNDLQNYTQELDVYSYVEANSRTISIVALAVVLLIGLYKNKSNEKKTEIFSTFMLLSFIFSVMILFIIWMPINNSYFIRGLREIKTVLLTYSISILLLGMLYFLQIGIKK